MKAFYKLTIENKSNVSAIDLENHLKQYDRDISIFNNPFNKSIVVTSEYDFYNMTETSEIIISFIKSNKLNVLTYTQQTFKGERNVRLIRNNQTNKFSLSELVTFKTL